MKNKIKIFLIVVLGLLIVAVLFPFEELFSQKGRSSFGGSRSSTYRSFGGSRTYQVPRSFGGSRSNQPFGIQRNVPRKDLSVPTTPRSNFGTPRSSFGGNRVGTQNYSTNFPSFQKRYGVPRKVITPSQLPTLPKNAVVNHYGDFASGLMMGYLMGHTSWLWYLPFHPAFYYSKPVQVVTPDGKIEYYPPTFDWGKFFMTWIIIGSIAFIVITYLKNRKTRKLVDNFYTKDLSKSSFV